MGMGVLYVGGLMSSAAALTVIPGRGTAALLTLFVVVWMGDTLAYFGGKALGRHKLYPAVSPKKTLEGSVAGLAGSVGGALLVDALVPTGLSPLSLVLLGLAGGAIEQAGDLSESVLKRCVGIKDSGNLLPGHGGMLDRIDGLLFAAPVVWAFFTF
jgi:phosphatidate cytidylyltransferase